MCFVSDLQENEEKFTLFGLIFPQGINNIYSIICIKPWICVIIGGVLHLGYYKDINKNKIFQCQPENAIFYFLWTEITLECKMVDIWWIMSRY